MWKTLFVILCCSFLVAPGQGHEGHRVGNSTASSATWYQMTVLSGDMIISWWSNSFTIHFNVKAKATGWVSLGFPTAGKLKMIGSNAVIGYMHGDAHAVVDDYFMNAEQVCSGQKGVCPITTLGGNPGLLSQSLEMVDGWMSLNFSRTRSLVDDFHPSLEASEIPIVFAFGNSLPLDDHHRNKGALWLQIDPQDASLDLTNEIIHGILMFLAWMVFIPAGVFTAALKKKIGNYWFRWHIFLQVSGLLLGFASLILIITSNEVNGFDHFEETHSILGLATMSLAVVTPILGVVADRMWKADRKTTPIFPDLIHIFLGYINVATASVTVFYGLWALAADQLFYILVAVWTGVIVLVHLVALGFRFSWFSSRSTANTYELMGSASPETPDGPN